MKLICFSPINLFYVNLIRDQLKNLKRKEKNFPGLENFIINSIEGDTEGFYDLRIITWNMPLVFANTREVRKMRQIYSAYLS